MIKAVNLSKTYYQGKTRIEAVKNISLEIQRKESVLITGPSGAGKSTLLHMLGGLDRPTEGKLFFDGANFYSLKDKTRSEIRNKKIGFVFQFYHLLPEFSVLENVMLPAFMGRKKVFRSVNEEIRRRAEALLGMVGLAGRVLHRPSELSGGESQRAAIARALMNYPEVLLCDEPTGNLDSKIGEEITDCLKALKEKHGMALVIVTHQERMHDDFDRWFRIQDGSIEELKHGSESLPEWQACRQ
ncbi:MAG: ABC transporter ATP-binding protein [Candidatus Omnitrophota bacterium]